jgi:hypothetical protein
MRHHKDDGNVVVVTLAVVAAFVAVIVIGIGIWQFDWFMKAKNVDRQTQIDRNNWGTQRTYESVVKAAIPEIAGLDATIANPNATAEQKAAWSAQRKAEVTKACDAASYITTPTAPVAAFIQENC